MGTKSNRKPKNYIRLYNFRSRNKRSRNNILARGKKTRKHRKVKRVQKGGTCYGRGVGANSYDPSFSIYNTRELQLFPYKPTN
jgi:hypothetical protein